MKPSSTDVFVANHNHNRNHHHDLAVSFMDALQVVRMLQRGTTFGMVRNNSVWNKP